MARTIINIPRLGFRRRGEVNWEKVAEVVTTAILIIVGSAWLIGLSYKGIWWVARKPPKVITKTVYVNEFTAAQNAYIQQCDSQSNGNGPAVPDVHTSPWTCKFPN